MKLKGKGINTRNWVGSAQDRNYWRTVVNAKLDFLVAEAMELVVTFGFADISD